MTQPLHLTGVVKQFDSFRAVDGISLSVNAGEVLGIVGPNGAGKTTTVKMILGLLEPTEGTISLFGSTINDPAVRRRLGYMPETPSFYGYLTGMELLRFVAGLFELPAAKITQRSHDLLDRVGLADAADRQLRTYSKGMLQRICLAQALINEPDLLFLDEPLDGLDPIGRIRMREVLLEIKQRGTAIMLNSHILSDVEVMSDTIAIIDHGKIVRHGPVSELIPKGKNLEEVFIEAVGA
jgi:ABC-2 type transport system ATP-binding protein